MVGEIAKNFTLKDQNGEAFNLYKNLNQKILLVFYPKDSSPVCSKQLADYNRHIVDFENLNVKVIGINTGGCDEHKTFCNSLGIDIKLLCDEEKQVSRSFSALNIFGINKRKLVLIGADRKIIFEKSTLAIKFDKAVKILSLIETAE